MNEHTSKELSQRLHDKGFRTEHKWAWATQDDVFSDIKKGDMVTNGISKCATIHAYTFTELSRIAPETLKIGKMNRLVIIKYPEYWQVGYLIGMETEDWHHWLIHGSIVEALGLLVEWLIDNGYMEVSQ